MPSSKPLLVVVGIGQGGGTGAATAPIDQSRRKFSNEGYSIALIARGADSLKSLETELKASGADATAFPIPSYEQLSLQSAFQAIRTRYPSPEYSIRAAVYNAGVSIWKPFLAITSDDIKATTQANVEGAFAFAHEVITEYRKNVIDEENGLEKKGVLIFTGATGSLRGGPMTSVFSAGKFALRALSQSLAKEFGKENVHVAHAIIDGVIVTPQGRERFSNATNYDNEDQRLSPEAIASAYVYLAKQPRSAWTWELDRA
ncbi:hypothetical protein D9757_008841 [Collybiopsis confluens]|uniref:Short-chain dehydrogenase/reductase SDR n=1 Tax=Collybiopsis confluens TaxID=2823264 RepID=A0A8H5M065_9AGAR|nr:hypothetical protein D9757_008841 [Collybiopsis confluens]